MKKIGVIGLGNWGTALANHLALLGNEVVGWCKETEIATSINENKTNPTFLSNVILDSKLRATNNIEELKDLSIILLVIPSSVLPLVAPIIPTSQKTVLVSAIKGLVKESCLTPIQYLKEKMPAWQKLAVISGPTFAKDIVRGKPSAMVAASEDESIAEIVQATFCGPTMKVFVSNDPLGVEIGGVVKNVIALAAGVYDGLELGDSARAGIITRGLTEIMRLGIAMGGQERTFSGLSGLGDLIMTATCDTSRNRTVGIRLGKGESLEAITKSLGSVAESVTTTPLVASLAEKMRVDMPVTNAMNSLLRGEIKPNELMPLLYSKRQLKEWP